MDEETAQLHVLQPEIDVPMFVAKNGLSSDDFVLVSSVLLARCKDTFVEFDSGSAWAQDLCVSMLRVAGLCRGSGRWLEVQQYNFSESTRARRSLQTLHPFSKGLQVAAAR